VPVAEVRELRSDKHAKRGAGPVETADMVEVEGLEASESRPALVEIAKRLARILDDPAATGHASVAKQLAATLEALYTVTRPAGRLASVTKLSVRHGGESS
jgi:hypothetical protein